MRRRRIVLITIAIIIITPILVAILAQIGVSKDYYVKQGKAGSFVITEQKMGDAIGNAWQGMINNVAIQNTAEKIRNAFNETGIIVTNQTSYILAGIIYVGIQAGIVEIICFIPLLLVDISNKIKNKLIYKGEKWLD